MPTSSTGTQASILNYASIWGATAAQVMPGSGVGAHSDTVNLWFEMRTGSSSEMFFAAD
jgi:hypothetical protein